MKKDNTCRCSRRFDLIIKDKLKIMQSRSEFLALFKSEMRFFMQFDSNF